MPDYDKLTPEEINRLCAERVGGQPAGESTYGPHPLMRDGLHYEVTVKSKSTSPDYCRDRNALEELWKFLDKNTMILRFLPLLGKWEWPMITATPRQHCVAFLRATEPAS